MASSAPVELSIQQEGLQALARALSKEGDGKAFRRDLAKSLRVAALPAVTDVKQAVMAIQSAGLSHANGGPLRQAVADSIKLDVRLTGKITGVRVRAPGSNMPRGFKKAAKNLDRQGGWRHPVFGNTDVWVQQTGQPYWYSTLIAHRDGYREAISEAMEEMARRIAKT